MNFTEIELIFIKMIMERVDELDILEQMFAGDELDFDLRYEYNNVLKKLTKQGI